MKQNIIDTILTIAILMTMFAATFRINEQARQITNLQTEIEQLQKNTQQTDSIQLLDSPIITTDSLKITNNGEIC